MNGWLNSENIYVTPCAMTNTTNSEASDSNKMLALSNALKVDRMETENTRSSRCQWSDSFFTALRSETILEKLQQSMEHFVELDILQCHSSIMQCEMFSFELLAKAVSISSRTRPVKSSAKTYLNESLQSDLFCIDWNGIGTSSRTIKWKQYHPLQVFHLHGIQTTTQHGSPFNKWSSKATSNNSIANEVSLWWQKKSTEADTGLPEQYLTNRVFTITINIDSHQCKIKLSTHLPMLKNCYIPYRIRQSYHDIW